MAVLVCLTPASCSLVAVAIVCTDWAIFSKALLIAVKACSQAPGGGLTGAHLDPGLVDDSPDFASRAIEQGTYLVGCPAACYGQFADFFCHHGKAPAPQLRHERPQSRR